MTVAMKTCSKCGEEKPLSLFHKNSHSKDGLYPSCKDCKNKQKQGYQKANPEKVKESKRREYKKHRERYLSYSKKYNKQYYQEHSDEILERTSLYRKKYPEVSRESTRRWRMKNPEKAIKKSRQYYWANPGKGREATANWRKSNPEKVKEQKKRAYERHKADPKFKLTAFMRKGIWKSLKGNKVQSWKDLVRYSTDDLKAHIEKQFQPGMTWKNYGEWHIDHEIPVSAFNFSKPEHMDFKKCWALKNLQPLWAKDNCSKQDKLIKPFQPALAMGV